MYIIFGLFSLLMGLGGVFMIIASLLWHTWAQLPIGLLFIFLSGLGFVLADIRMLLVQQKIRSRMGEE
jgi:hypothetical protein